MNTEVSHFWVSYFDTEDDFFDFFGEDPDYYSDENDSDEKYISKFAKSQGENWIDHDFMECGFENTDVSITEKFKAYSYAKEWSLEIEQRIQKRQIEKVNSIVFVTKNEISKPTDVLQDKYYLFYVGEIEYDI